MSERAQHLARIIMAADTAIPIKVTITRIIKAMIIPSFIKIVFIIIVDGIIVDEPGTIRPAPAQICTCVEICLWVYN
jgi:hypothetical protein